MSMHARQQLQEADWIEPTPEERWTAEKHCTSFKKRMGWE